MHDFPLRKTLMSVQQWLLPSPPSAYVRKAEEFASFLQGLLRSRHVVEQLVLDPETNCLMPFSKKDDSVRKWFETIGLGSCFPFLQLYYPYLSVRVDSISSFQQSTTGAICFIYPITNMGQGPDLPLRRNAEFSQSDPSSLHMKHCARFVLSAQMRGQIGFEE